MALTTKLTDSHERRHGPRIREHGRLAHDRQHLAGHVDDDRVRVAVGSIPASEPRPAIR